MTEKHSSDPSRPGAGGAFPSEAYRIGGLDSVDACRLRLTALRVRINTNWPASSGLLRRPKRPESHDTLRALMAALPTPLPLERSGVPEALMRESDTDLRAIAERAVDAAMLLLDAGSLDAVYRGEVTMLAGLGASTSVAGPEPVVLSDPTVGLLVATIIGTLEAVSESLIPSSGKRNVSR